MKNLTKEVLIGIFGGAVGGVTASFIYLNIHVNWTAIACLISILVLIVTIIENRISLRKDLENKVRTSIADQLIKDMSVYVGNYHECQKTTIDIFSNPTHEKKQHRNDIISNMEFTLSKIRMLELRTSKEELVQMLMKNLVNEIEKVNNQINEFYRNNKDINCAKCIQKQGSMEDKRVKNNISSIESISSEIYRALVSVDY